VEMRRINLPVTGEGLIREILQVSRNMEGEAISVCLLGDLATPLENIGPRVRKGEMQSAVCRSFVDLPNTTSTVSLMSASC